MSLYYFGRNLLAFLMKFTYHIHVEYEEPLTGELGFILACNHTSNMDPVVLSASFHRKIRYMAKSELFELPVVGFIFKQLEAFPVARGKGDTAAIKSAVEIVKAGGVLGIFPEGGRSRDGKLQKMKSGAVIVAAQTGSDIVPACILYGKRRWFRRRPVSVKFGRILKNAELNVREHSKTEIRAGNALLGARITGLMGEEAP